MDEYASWMNMMDGVYLQLLFGRVLGFFAFRVFGLKRHRVVDL